MILQLQAKVHGLGYLGVSTYTYPILNDFKATFSLIIIKIKLSMIFSKASLPVWFRNLLDHPPTWPESESHMILQLQAKVHDLGNLRVLTYTYSILSEFKATFCFLHPFLPSSLPPSLTINFCTVVVTWGTRSDYDDKFLYSRSYSGSRADYDDK